MKSILKPFHSVWRIPLLVTLSVSAILVALFLYSPNGSLFYFFILAPILCATLLSLLLAAAVSREVHRAFTVLLTLAGFLAASWLLLKNERVLRPELRWLFRSQHYKAELLAQPNMATGLKHLEWDSWGFVPSGNNTVYLVYDPSDSLRSPHPGTSGPTVSGIPCEMAAIHRLERQWYWVLFYTDEDWGHCSSAK
jgi:hypothetical protein